MSERKQISAIIKEVEEEVLAHLERLQLPIAILSDEVLEHDSATKDIFKNNPLPNIVTLKQLIANPYFAEHGQLAMALLVNTMHQINAFHNFLNSPIYTLDQKRQTLSLLDFELSFLLEALELAKELVEDNISLERFKQEQTNLENKYIVDVNPKK